MSLRIGVVGVGHMGRIHLAKLLSIDGVAVSGIVDTDHTLAENVSREYQVPLFRDLQDMYRHTDAAVLATPTATHFEIARSMLQADIHVFLEKPITAKSEEARQLVNLAEKKRRVLQVGHLERFNPAYTKALSLIRKPLLIETSRVSSFTGRSTDVDVVLDLMIHDIDLVLSLAQSEIRDLRAQGISFVMDKLDMATARIEFVNGSVANLTANRISTRKERLVTIFEKERLFFLDLLKGTLVTNIKDRNGSIITEEHTTDPADAVRYELIEFARSIQENRGPVVQGEHGLKALILAEQIKQYIADNSP
jgi:predicted dehydrogenase